MGSIQAIMDSYPSSKYNMLLTVIADQGDAAATVYIYDKMKACNIKVDEVSWIALNKLERSKHFTIYSVPPSDKIQLNPSRRIHKICKGPRLHERSEAAKLVYDDVISWLKTNDISKFARIKQAQLIAKGLSIPLESARGVVTKLKMKGILS